MHSRRNFIKGSLSLLAATGTSQWCAAAGPAVAALEDPAARFHDFVTGKMMDADGLCRSMLNAETFRPWTEQQLTKLDSRLLTDMFQNSPDKSGCLAYENALMATGEFAQSQMVRHRVTGEPAALELAERGVRAMLAVAGEGRHYMPGFLPKPFGGLARARYSHELSPDQYTKVVAALHAWRPQASAKERAAIDRFFVEAADFFIARKFRHAFRHRTIVTADTHHHSLGLFVSIVVLAANVSGKAGYRAHLKEFSRALDDSATDEKLANFNMTSLLIDGFDVAIKEGCDDPRLPELIKSLWIRAIKNIDPDGTSYEGENRRNVTPEGTRAAACATMVEKLHPATQATALAAKVLHRYTQIQQMVHYRIPGAIFEVSVTSWLLAYWRLREKAK
ncbi:MAG: hypothetical protein HY736_08425 [Verrucomicrobia bacterium]|nr:hypothetical protein [Verrucomicrobiota bacterium]